MGGKVVSVFQQQELLHYPLPDEYDTGLTRRRCGCGLEDGADAATGFLENREERTTSMLMAMPGCGKSHGYVMDAVLGKELPSSGGEDVVIGTTIHHDITRVQMVAEVKVNLFEMRPPLQKHQDGFGATEEHGEFFDGSGDSDRQPLRPTPEFRTPGRIRIIACNRISLAGYGQDKVAAKEAKTKNTDCAGFDGVDFNHVRNSRYSN